MPPALQQFVIALCLVVVPAAAQTRPAIPERTVHVPMEAEANARHSLRISLWTSRSGLPQNTVSGIARTADGMLWIGTYGGLVRFDGRRFKIFDVTNTPALKSNRITALCRDSDDRLWIAADGITILENGRFRAGPPDVLRGPITGLAEDSEGTVWAAGRGVVGLRDEVVRPDGPRGPMRRLISIDGEVWAASWNANHPEPVVEANGRLDRHGFERLVSAGDSRRSADRFRALPEVSEPGRIEAACRDDRGTLWVGTTTGLLVVTSPFERGDVVFRRALPAEFDSEVMCLFADGEGSIWVGTHGSGLIRLTTRPFAVIGPDDGLPGNGVYAVCSSSAGGWLFTRRNAKRCWRLHEGRITETLNGPTNGRTLLETSDGAIWTAAKKKLYRHHDGRVTEFDVPENAISLIESRDGSIWGAGYTGVFRFRDEVLESHGPDDGCPEGAYLALAEGPDGEIWFGGNFGVGRIKGGAVEVLDRSILPRGDVRSIALDSYGGVWIASYGGGIACIRGDDVRVCTTQHGLPDNNVCKLLRDAEGRFWINSNAGVTLVREADLLAFADGRVPLLRNTLLRTPEGSGRHGALAMNGRVCFPTIDGLALVTPDASPPDGGPHPVHVTLETASTSIEGVQRITLPPGDRDLAFHLVSPSFEFEPTYRYRLVGYDDRWHMSMGEAGYAGVPPGEHRLEVAAMDALGRIGPETTLVIVVPPAWHETLLFRGLAVLLLAAIAWYGFLVLTGVQRRHRQGLEAEIDDRRRIGMRLAGVRDEERRRIARELHDDFSQRLAATAIDLAALKLDRGSAGELDVPRLEQATEQVRGVADDVHALSRRLHPSAITDLGLGRAVEIECRDFEERTGIAIRFDASSGIDGLTERAALAAYRVVQEALRNVHKHSNASSAVVSLRRRHGEVVVVVEDGGVGFDTSALQGNGGLGINSMRERVESQGGSFVMRSVSGGGTLLEAALPFEAEAEAT